MRVHGTDAVPKIDNKEMPSAVANHPGTNRDAAQEEAEAASTGQGFIGQLPTTTVLVRDGDQTVYEIRDRQTGHLISQIPSQEALRVAKNISEFADQRLPEAKVSTTS